MNVIESSKLAFTYDGEAYALNGVDLCIAQGEFVCILGGNGSGKSTFAKHINALLIPDEGSMRVDGFSTSDEENLYAIRSNAGMVFQNPDDQLVASIVEDDVAFGPENLGLQTPEIAAQVKRALKEVGMMGFEKHETHALSGGQKQRVAIAGVLAMDPKILILDEASSMLDPRGRKGLMRVCKELHERGMTVVMITHFMEEAAEADRVIVMENGSVALCGTPEEVLVRTDVLSTLNLEVPYACTLSLKLQDAGLDVAPHVSEEALVDDVCALLGVGEAGTHAPVILNNATATEAPGAGASQESAHEASTAVDTTNDAIIAFENVSYTYDAAAHKKQQKLARKGKNPAPAADAERAAWGNDPSETWAVHNVSFAVKRGEFFGIAGHTGSGKSTVIQHMNGILNPTHGRVLVHGKDVSNKQNAIDARTHVGVVFQYPEHQLFANTVFEDVAFGPRNMGLTEDEVDCRVRESLARVGLDFDRIAQASPFELSGGQQRRVAFAGVLAMRPDVLVLDEPMAGLDPNARHEFLTLVDGLHEQGLTVVMVSHSMDDLAQLCQRMAVLKEGELFCVGTPQSVFRHADELNAIGLGLPAAQRMANSLRTHGVALPEDEFFTMDSLAERIAQLAREEQNAAAAASTPAAQPHPTEGQGA